MQRCPQIAQIAVAKIGKSIDFFGAGLGSFQSGSCRMSLLQRLVDRTNPWKIWKNWKRMSDGANHWKYKSSRNWQKNGGYQEWICYDLFSTYTYIIYHHLTSRRNLKVTNLHGMFVTHTSCTCKRLVILSWNHGTDVNRCKRSTEA